MNTSSSWYSTTSEGCVSNDFFRHSLDDSQISYLIKVSGPSRPTLNVTEMLVMIELMKK